MAGIKVAVNNVTCPNYSFIHFLVSMNCQALNLILEINRYKDGFLPSGVLQESKHLMYKERAILNLLLR